MVMMMQLMRRYRYGGCSHESTKDQKRGSSEVRKSRTTGSESFSITAVERTPVDNNTAFNGNILNFFGWFFSFFVNDPNRAFLNEEKIRKWE